MPSSCCVPCTFIDKLGVRGVIAGFRVADVYRKGLHCNASSLCELALSIVGKCHVPQHVYRILWRIFLGVTVRIVPSLQGRIEVALGEVSISKVEVGRGVVAVLFNGLAKFGFRVSQVLLAV